MRTGWAAIGIAVALAGCNRPKEVWTEKGWVRLSAVKGQPAAAYLTIHGGPAPATLISITTDVAIKSEMHESMGGGMTALPRLAIPARTTVKFAPGGKHVMLFNVNPGIRPGSTMTLPLTFADGTRILQDAAVVAAGDPQP